MISRTSKAARITWSSAYFFFMLAGIVAMFSPIESGVLTTLLRALVYVWCAFLFAGGALSLGGKLWNSWVGEIIGLPLLSAANYVFGVLLLVRGTTPAAFAFGGILCGIATAFVARWIELRTLAKVNRGVNSES